jgi:hypothetical protein
MLRRNHRRPAAHSEVMAAFRGPQLGLSLVLPLWLFFAAARAGASAAAMPGRQAPLANALPVSVTPSSTLLIPTSRLHPPAAIALSTRLRNGIVIFVRRHKTA